MPESRGGPSVGTKAYRTKAQLAFEQLRRIIADGELRPGAPLRQRMLAKRLGMSLTPVREAIRRLEAEGLLSGLPHRTLRVRDVTSDQVSDVYAVRAILEGDATRLAASRIKPEDLGRLDRYLARMATCLRSAQLTTYSSLDEAFHMLIYRQASNRVLFELIEGLWSRYPRDALWTIAGRPGKSLREHRRIFGALKTANGPDAGRLMSSHILTSMGAILEYLNSQEGAAAGNGRKSRNQAGIA